MAKYLVEIEVDEDKVKSSAIDGGYESPTAIEAVEAELAWSIQSGINVINVEEDNVVYDVYIDGGCINNKRGEGLGGYGIVILKNGEVIHKSGGYRNKTTNNRMEVFAAIAAIKKMKHIIHCGVNDRFIIHSDSTYLVDNWNYNLMTWVDNNWRRTHGKEVLNKDLWCNLFEHVHMFNKISFEWVKGHSGEEYNNMADKIARKESNAHSR